MERLIYYGETFSGKKGIEIGECIYCCEPLEAIKRYCSDEIHVCDMENYTWILWDKGKEKLIYKGEKQ